VHPAWESCDAAGAFEAGAGDAPALDDSFQPVSAILCPTPILHRPAPGPGNDPWHPGPRTGTGSDPGQPGTSTSSDPREPGTGTGGNPGQPGSNPGQPGPGTDTDPRKLDPGAGPGQPGNSTGSDPGQPGPGTSSNPGLPDGVTGTEQRATDIEALVEALRLPDEKPTDGACTTEMVNLPWIALLDASGRWIHPGTPADACRKPRKKVRLAVAELVLTGASPHPTPSPTGGSGGCPQRWADMVWASGEWGGNGGTPDNLTASSVRVCAYTVPQGQRGGGKPTGEFDAARTLTPAQWAMVKRELSAAPEAVPCRTPASRFAVLHLDQSEIYVEADGCHRALINGSSGVGALRKASPTVSALVFN
jgi:hypothetical protein